MGKYSGKRFFFFFFRKGLVGAKLTKVIPVPLLFFLNIFPLNQNLKAFALISMFAVCKQCH